MHRLIAQFLLVIMAFSSLIDLHDLSKMAMLFNHYQEHIANGKTTLSEFIDLHYGSQAEQHDKEHGHRSLPFKSHESASTHHITAFFDLHLQLESGEVFASDPSQSHYPFHFTPGYISSIFQPPKQLI